MSAKAVAWLTDFALKKPAFTFANFQRDFGRVKNGAGFNGKQGVKAKAGKTALRAWVPDYMRHTAISIQFAFHKHEGETANWAGNPRTSSTATTRRSSKKPTPKSSGKSPPTTSHKQSPSRQPPQPARRPTRAPCAPQDSVALSETV